MDKRVKSLAAALADAKDGSTVLCSGFGAVGEPVELLNALLEQGAKDLVCVANNAGTGEQGLAGLIKAGKIELELVPQGTLSERMRAAAAGLGGFYTRVSVGTKLEAGKEVREIDGVAYVLEKPIQGDLALVKAARADRWGNLVYRKSARNFNPVMAMAGKLTVAQVTEVVDLGALDPESVHTPGIFVDRVVVV
jgi:3-oxoadipate CoA-transferase alpha subunit